LPRPNHSLALAIFQTNRSQHVEINTTRIYASNNNLNVIVPEFLQNEAIGKWTATIAIFSLVAT
jgi:hypothetical protein